MNRALKRGTLLVMTLCLLGCASLALADTVPTNIPVKLTLTGQTPPGASDFTFVLAPATPQTPMPATNTLSITGAGTGEFGPLSYNEPNDYVYTLYQTPGNVTGYTYDARIYTVTVQVTSDVEGMLTATVYLNDGSGNKPTLATFSNNYSVTTEIPRTGYGTHPRGLWALLFDRISLVGMR